MAFFVCQAGQSVRSWPQSGSGGAWPYLGLLRFYGVFADILTPMERGSPAWCRAELARIRKEQGKPKLKGKRKRLPAEERRRRNHLARLRNYKLDEEAYDYMVDSQGGLCAICEREPRSGNRPLPRHRQGARSAL